nr:hypothetical protein [Malaciobacter halophilus]
MKNQFSQDDKKKSMQQLSLVHIEVQKYLETTIAIDRCGLYQFIII